jgi:uncharacterized protein YuzE
LASKFSPNDYLDAANIIYDQNADHLTIELPLGVARSPGPTHRVNDHIRISLDEHGAPGAIHIDNAAQNVTEPGTIEFRKIITF